MGANEMCWMTPMALTLDEDARTRRVGLVKVIFSSGLARQTETTPERARRQAYAAQATGASGLGSARAGARWGWARSARAANDTVRPASAELATTKGSAQLEETMAEAGRLLGRSADAIWTEAAHEWLGRHLGLAAITETNDDPPPTAPAAMAAAPRRGRCWAEIDTLLADLRVGATPQTAA